MPDRYIKCRFCGYSVLPFRRSKRGKISSGWTRLEEHIADEHEQEQLAERRKIDAYMRKREAEGS